MNWCLPRALILLRLGCPCLCGHRRRESPLRVYDLLEQVTEIRMELERKGDMQMVEALDGTLTAIELGIQTAVTTRELIAYRDLLRVLAEGVVGVDREWLGR